MSEPEPTIPAGFPTDEWTVADVLRYLATRGRVITPDTWYVYMNRHQAPEPVRYIGRTPVFDPIAIIRYQDNYRGPGRPRKDAAEA